MSLKTLTFQSIEDFDNGSVALAVNKALRQAYLDCADRPTLTAARKITLEIAIKPKGGDRRSPKTDSPGGQGRSAGVAFHQSERTA